MMMSAPSARMMLSVSGVMFRKLRFQMIADKEAESSVSNPRHDMTGPLAHAQSRTQLA
jgi:hypothetical protein